MNTYRRVLRDAAADQSAGGGGGGAAPQLNAFVQGLPAEFHTEKSLHNIDSVTTLAKGYVHAQKMIGAKRVEAPDGTWNDAKWNEFYDTAGRPKTASDYKVPAYEFKADKTLKVDAAKLEAVKSNLHAAGLNQRQADKVLTTYFESLDADIATSKQTADSKRAEVETKLKAEWGDKYAPNIDLAKAVVTKYGDPEFMEYINEGGGNDPRLVKALARMGAAMMEDKSRGGNAADALQITDATRATQEIARLKLDADFQKALTQKAHPGHNAAVQQWTNLFKVSSPNKVVEPS